MTDAKIDLMLQDIASEAGRQEFSRSFGIVSSSENLRLVIRTHLAPYEALRVAAQAVVARWGSPHWKEAEPTGKTIADLRQALAALEEVKG